MSKNTPDAKNRILKAAVKIFAEKSFDGSRVDEIAKEAGVPKSLIYYHFKSKEHILEVLTQNFIDKYMKLADSLVGKDGRDKSEGMVQRVRSQYYEFGKENEDLVRVMFIDSLKKVNEVPIIFKVVEEMVKAGGADNTALQDREAVSRQLVVEFFTSLIPLYTFICFSDSWVNYFKMDKEELGKLFTKFIIEPHAEYHKKYG